MRTIRITFFLLFTAVSAQAQDTWKFFQEEKVERIDTARDLLHVYHHSYRPGKFFQNLGNIATPSFPLFPDPYAGPGFNYQYDPYKLYRLTPEKLPFYKTFSPYTDLSYYQGGNNFQNLRGLHTQNISPRFNIALKFDRQVSDGFYIHQRTDHFNAGISSWYSTLNGRYKIYGRAIFNKIENEENGGVEEGFGLNINAPVRNNDLNHMDRSKTFQIQQYYYPGEITTDTLAGDDTLVYKQIRSKFYFKHDIRYTVQKISFTDPTPLERSGGGIFFDENETNDTTGLRQLQNEFLLILPGDSGKSGYSASLGFGIKNSFLFLQGNEFDFHDFYIKARGRANFAGIGIEGGGYYVLAGQQGNYLADILVTRPSDSGITLSAGVKLHQRQPWFKEELIISNHVYFLNRFADQNFKEIFARAEFNLLGKWKTQAGMFRITKPVYFTEELKTTQFYGTTHLLYWKTGIKFNYGRLHIYQDLLFQRELETDILRLPEFVSRTSLFVRMHLAKGNLIMDVGPDLRFTSAHFGKGYYPVQTIFYNQDENMTGGYPFLSFFIEITVKSFKAFLKLEHANYGFTEGPSYTAPYYPDFPRTIRFGINWRFRY